ncbi:multiheme c-type cytochrome [Psychromonas hadalis]|uniref:multiheme c-type cytochrome n=1 Tax=Psychromonas hadalis TaxID=211669 RepID=UPI0003B7A0A4|nr:multiheme c-type cytochrome [Psychromonas hadalis]
MDNVKLAIATMINALLILCITGFLSTVSAETPPTKAHQVDIRHVVTYNRDSDYKCTQCHKDAKQSLLNTHGEKVTEELGKELKCVQCHDTISADHRENSPTVTKYSPAQSKMSSNKHQLSFESILSSTANCTECHTPAKLREQNWTHDVHAKNATCSNCHVVHADGETQGIQAKPKKQQIEMCVACHQDFNSTDFKGE